MQPPGLNDQTRIWGSLTMTCDQQRPQSHISVQKERERGHRWPGQRHLAAAARPPLPEAAGPPRAGPGGSLRLAPAPPRLPPRTAPAHRGGPHPGHVGHGALGHPGLGSSPHSSRRGRRRGPITPCPPGRRWRGPARRTGEDSREGRAWVSWAGDEGRTG